MAELENKGSFSQEAKIPTEGGVTTAPHAPGPWKAAPKAAWFRGQRHPDDGKIAIHPVGGTGTIANVYGRGNARLIAAAPFLLDALEDLMDAIGTHDPDWDWQERQAARDAIAEAKGIAK